MTFLESWCPYHGYVESSGTKVSAKEDLITVEKYVQGNQLSFSYTGHNVM